MVVGWNEGEKRAEYLRLPKTRHAKVIQLFLHEGHDSTITSMSALTQKDFGKNTYYFCPYYPFHHQKCVEFKNWEYTLRKPHVIYADFESCLVKRDVVKGKNTTQTQIHKPDAYCYHLVSDIVPADNITVQYTAKTNDENIPLYFIKSLSQMANRLGEKYAESRPMVITEEEQALFNAATTCWVCGEETMDGDEKLRKVRDHCHFTRRYRGAAHNMCNLKLKRDKSIPVLFHNGTGYDFHLFMRDLGRIPGKISVIAKRGSIFPSPKILSLVRKILED